MSADARFVDAHPDSTASSPRVRGVIVAAIAALGALAVLALLAPSAGALPAGRAYEKVSPNDKDGQDILNGLDKAAVTGDAATYISFGAFADSDGGGLVTSFTSDRSATDWTTHSIGPEQVTVPTLASSLYVDFSDDVQTSLISYLNGDPAFDGATPGSVNLYRRDPDGSKHVLTFGETAPPPGGFPASPTWGGGSADLAVGTYSQFGDPLLPTTSGPPSVAGVNNAYVSTGNHDVELVSVLPNGTSSPSGGTIGGSGFSPGYNTVSDNGSRIIWSSGDGEIYDRINGSATKHVSADQRTVPDPNGVQPKGYAYATPDGSMVFFASSQKLTNNSQAEPGLPDLYRYNVASGTLTDLTTGDPNGAGVQGVIGTSDNGNRVYFGATGSLAAGAPTGGLNLYARDGGTTHFITALDPSFSDTSNWATDNSKTGRVTASGGTLMFSSHAPQLGYDNAGFAEFYVYDLASDSFQCVSCRPNGDPATGDAIVAQPQGGGISLSGLSTYERRNLSADGSTVFFGSPERLLGSDTNGKYDVYMWQDGGVELVSTGQSVDDSAFVDASANGNNAFFLTRQQLVGIDTDDSIDLYDARVGGGLASQNPPPPPPPCQGDTCKPPASPQTGPPPNGTSSVNNPPEPPIPDCSDLDKQADKANAKVDKLQKKVGKASGKQKKKLKKKLKKAKKQAKSAQQAADACNQG